MKPFGLDTVLDYRQRLEDIAKNNLAQARQAEEEVRHQLEKEQDHYRQLVATIERVQEIGVNIMELIHHEEHLKYIKTRVIELEKELKKKREHIARTRKELMKKAKDRQVMEKLKERQNADWQQYLNKKEAAILDEIAIIFHNK
ncbi:flagellar export protein FliJ [Desulfopila aestuarii]|uniref:Flagellar FliJ protein n=1 Tax=Desulfopila aestuarii DSM 18488 TaxID=1121416 RepID=A0A1M7YDL2_9BACT|nr:flagellar export protein FliJ [Desulfopila aestuarii]SHO50715.1 flagellar FliJ protein [Desulfopila aestuarii DSM 18488]